MTSVVFGRTIAHGQKMFFRAPLAELPDGTPVSAPVMVACGSSSGPTLCLTACSHGDEYNGVAAIGRLFSLLDPLSLRGTVIGLPVLNPFAYYAESRLNVFDYELQNLNRLFPGDADGDLGQRIAYALFTGAIEQADWLMDFHEGGRDFMARYLSIGGVSARGPLAAKEEQMARWFGHGVPVAVTEQGDVDRRPGFSGTLTAACARHGIPSMAVELGGSGRLWEEFVALAVAGTRNVMMGLGMISGTIQEADRPQHFCNVLVWPRPSRGGLLVPRPESTLNALVTKGQVLADIVDPFGTIVEHISAPFDAVLLDTRHSAVVYPGDWTYHCGHV